MRYDYMCKICSTKKKLFVFETSHGMTEKPKIKCPKCSGVDTEIAFLTTPVSYIRGQGWLDVSGRRRDMNLWKLQNDDPYKRMRQRGEKDDMVNKLKRGGKHNPKTKYF